MWLVSLCIFLLHCFAQFQQMLRWEKVCHGTVLVRSTVASSWQCAWETLAQEGISVALTFSSISVTVASCP